jgi:hypothetical protein
MFYWLLGALFKSADFALVAPEAMVSRILLLDELIIIEISC